MALTLGASSAMSFKELFVLKGCKIKNGQKSASNIEWQKDSIRS